MREPTLAWEEREYMVAWLNLNKASERLHTKQRIDIVALIKRDGYIEMKDGKFVLTDDGVRYAQQYKHAGKL